MTHTQYNPLQRSHQSLMMHPCRHACNQTHMRWSNTCKRGQTATKHTIHPTQKKDHTVEQRTRVLDYTVNVLIVALTKTNTNFLQLHMLRNLYTHTQTYKMYWKTHCGWSCFPAAG